MLAEVNYMWKLHDHTSEQKITLFFKNKTKKNSYVHAMRTTLL